MDELNDIFRQAAAEYTLQPAPRVWEAVTRDLDKRERRRRGLIWWWSLLGILILGIAGYLLFAGIPGGNAAKIENHHGPGSAPARATDAPARQSKMERPPVSLHATQQRSRTTLAAVPRPDLVRAETGHPAPASREANLVATPVTALRPGMLHRLGSEGQPPVLDDSRYAVAAFEPEPLMLAAAAKPRILETPLARAASPRALELPPLPPLPESPAEPRPEEHVSPIEARAVGTLAAAAIAPQPELRPFAPGVEVPRKAEAPPVPISMTPIRMQSSAPIPAVNPAVLPAPSVQHTLPPTEQLSLLAAPAGRLLPASAAEAGPARSLPIPAAASLIPVTEPAAAAIQVDQKQESAPALPAPVQATASRWSLSAGIFATSSWHSTRDSSLATVIDDSMEDRRKFVAPGYQLRIGYQLRPWIEIRSGLGFQTLGETYGAVQPVRSFGIGTANVVRLRALLIGNDSAAMLRTRFSYLELPLGIRLRLLERQRFSLLLDAGVSANALIRSSGYAYDSVQNSYQPIDRSRVASWLAAYNGGLSLRYRLSPLWAAELTGWYRYIPEPVFRDEQPAIRKYYHQAGAGLMLRYQFGNRKQR